MDLLTQLNRAMEYIEAHIADGITIADASSVTSYSPYHFGRLFYYITDMPTEDAKWNPDEKNLANQGFFGPERPEITNVPIPGFLFSMDMEQTNARRKVKPVWTVHVCVALGGGL